MNPWRRPASNFCRSPCWSPTCVEEDRGPAMESQSICITCRNTSVFSASRGSVIRKHPWLFTRHRSSLVPDLQKVQNNIDELRDNLKHTSEIARELTPVEVRGSLGNITKSLAVGEYQSQNWKLFAEKCHLDQFWGLGKDLKRSFGRFSSSSWNPKLPHKMVPHVSYVFICI